MFQGMISAYYKGSSRIGEGDGENRTKGGSGETLDLEPLSGSGDEGRAE
jgi:hypothetical protein